MAETTASYKTGVTAAAEMTAEDIYNRIERLTREMKEAAKLLEFEKAAALRDELGELRQRWSDMHEVGRRKPRAAKGQKQQK